CARGRTYGDYFDYW
nr:immunoglobulin heavy chain junction region [Mus musculus]